MSDTRGARADHPMVWVLLIAAGWIVFGAAAALQGYVFDRFSADPAQPLSGWLGFYAPRWVPWAFLTPIVLWLARRVPIERGQVGRSVAYHAATGALIAIVHNIVAVQIYRLVFPQTMGQRGFWELLSLQVETQLSASFLFYWLILGSAHAVAYYRKYQEGSTRAAALEGQVAAARLQALEMQLQPHFLFNTLHAIGVLVRREPSTAEQMIARLGDLLRETLDRSGGHEVALREELRVLQLYLDVEQVRFRDRLAVRIEVPVGLLEARVPIFVLQPLVENAIRHGVAQQPGQGWIDIVATRCNGRIRMTVENRGEAEEEPNGAAWGEGVGLRTTRQRLQSLYGDAHLVEVRPTRHGAVAAVEFPMRPTSGDVTHAAS